MSKWRLSKSNFVEYLVPLLGISVLAATLPGVFGNLDSVFGWRLELTIRLYMVTLIGIPLAGIAISAGFLLIGHRGKSMLPRRILLLVLPTVPGILFWLLSRCLPLDEAWVIGISAVVMPALTVLAIRSDIPKPPDQLADGRMMRRYVGFFPIITAVQLGFLSMAYPWLGKSEMAWMIPAIGFLPTLPAALVAYQARRVLWILHPWPSASNRYALAVAAFGFLVFYPELDLQWLMAILCFLNFGFSAYLMSRSRMPGWNRFIPVIVAAFFLAISMVRLASSEQVPDLGVEAGAKETFMRAADTLDIVDSDKYYQKYFLPERARTHRLLGQLELLNQLAEQNVKRVVMLSPKQDSIETHRDPLMDGEIAAMLDRVMKCIRLDAQDRLTTLADSKAEGPVAELRGVYGSYYHVEVANSQDKIIDVLEPGMVAEASLAKLAPLANRFQMSPKVPGSSATETNSGTPKDSYEQTRAEELGAARLRIQQFEQVAGNKMATDREYSEFYRDLFYTFSKLETPDALDTLRTVLAEKSNDQKIFVNSPSLKTLFEDNGKRIARLEGALASGLSSGMPDWVPNEKKELVLLSLYQPIVQMEGLMFIALQPRSKTLLEWQGAYSRYLDKFNEYWYVRVAERARQGHGKEIVRSYRKLVVFHMLTLGFLAIMAMLLLRRQVLRPRKFLAGIAGMFVVAIISTFDLGLYNLIDIEAARKSSIVPGWNLDKNEATANKADGSLNSDEEILRELRLIREELRNLKGFGGGGSGFGGATERYHIQKEKEIKDYKEYGN